MVPLEGGVAPGYQLSLSFIEQREWRHIADGDGMSISPSIHFYEADPSAVPRKYYNALVYVAHAASQDHGPDLPGGRLGSLQWCGACRCAPGGAEKPVSPNTPGIGSANQTTAHRQSYVLPWA